jgi:deoxyribonuclease-4
VQNNKGDMKLPHIGAHVSISGGIDDAPERARKEGCDMFQCFTRSPQGGTAQNISPELVKRFATAMQAHGIEQFYIHAPYYINLSSREPRIRHSSHHFIRDELERGTLLGARYVITHIGSYTGQTQREGIERSITGIGRALDGYDGITELLIEISAGTGNIIGDTFEEIGAIVHACKKMKGFGGVCFDTCHAFASGYDFRTPETLHTTLEQFDALIGFQNLKLVHVNDSVADINGKRDRHEHIGKGHIGKEGIELILSSPPFRAIDWVLETHPQGRKKDVAILSALRTRLKK